MLHLRVDAQFWWAVAESRQPDGRPIRLAAFCSKEAEPGWRQVGSRLSQRWWRLCSATFPPQIKRGNLGARDSRTGSEGVRTGRAEPVPTAPGDSSPCCTRVCSRGGLGLTTWNGRARRAPRATALTPDRARSWAHCCIEFVQPQHSLDCHQWAEWMGPVLYWRELSHPAVPGIREQTSAEQQPQTSTNQCSTAESKRGSSKGWGGEPCGSSTHGAEQSFPGHFHRCKSRTASLDFAQCKFIMIYVGSRIKELAVQTPAGADPNVPRSDFKQKKIQTYYLAILSSFQTSGHQS